MVGETRAGSTNLDHLGCSLRDSKRFEVFDHERRTYDTPVTLNESMVHGFPGRLPLPTQNCTEPFTMENAGAAALVS